jgi:hypothetical protein
VEAISHDESHARDTFRGVGIAFCQPTSILDGRTIRGSTINCLCARRCTDGGAAGATIAAEGELKATVRTYQSGNPSAVYRYYWWRDSCYVRYQSDNYELVSPEYCHQQH